MQPGRPVLPRWATQKKTVHKDSSADIPVERGETHLAEGTAPGSPSPSQVSAASGPAVAGQCGP